MKTTLTSTLAALSVVLLVTLSLSSCESRRNPGVGRSHNMAVGPKDRNPMPDANMPGRY